MLNVIEAVFQKKKYRLIPVTVTVVLVIITNMLLKYYQIEGDSGRFIKFLVTTNFITSLSCLVGASTLIYSALKRTSSRHLFSVASVYMGTFIALLGTSIFSIVYYLILNQNHRAIALSINIITAIFGLLISSIIYVQRKTIITLPDLAELMEIRKELENEILVLKTTHPHLSGKTEGSHSEILNTLEKASAFLEKLNSQ